MKMFNIEDARKLLIAADLFFEPDEDEPNFPKQMLNLSDTWYWASADGEEVTDAELPVVAELFWHYGWCGILFWVAEKRKHPTQFKDNNRFIQFVQQEEKIRREIPGSTERACHAATYVIGTSE